jgi:hypothetical protein
VFGTSVFFRTHPKGGMTQPARALFWASPDAEGVPTPVRTTTTLTVEDSDVTYPEDVKLSVVVGSLSGDNDPVGTVEILSGDQVLDSAELGEADQGRAAFTLSDLTPGRYPLRARFTPTQESPFLKSVSQTTSVVVRKVTSTIILKVGDRAAAGKPAPARIRVTAPGVTPVGTVVIRDNGRVIETVTLEEATQARSGSSCQRWSPVSTACGQCSRRRR